MTDVLVVRHRVAHIVRFVALGALCLILSQLAASAQSGTSRPIRLLMPYSPGSGWDTMVRVLAQAVEDAKTIIVDNRPGANAHRRRQRLQERRPGWDHDLRPLDVEYDAEPAAVQEFVLSAA